MPARRYRRRVRVANRWRISIALFVATATATAGADGAKLTYTRGPGAESCPDEPALREAVSQKVGRDPFDVEDVFVDLNIERRMEALQAQVEVRDGSIVRGRRVLSSTSSSCDELASALVVTISVALDPARFGARTRRTAPAPTASPADRPFAEEPLSSAPRTDEARRGFTWDVGAGVGAGFGVAPAPAAAFLLSFGAHWERTSIHLEGRMHPRASKAALGGRVSASSSMAALVPCFHVEPVAFCAVAAGGVLRGEGRGVTDPSTDSSFAAAAGVRVAAELLLAPAVGVRAGIDGMATIHGTRLTLDGKEAWATPTWWASTWAGVVLHFR